MSPAESRSSNHFVRDGYVFLFDQIQAVESASSIYSAPPGRGPRSWSRSAAVSSTSHWMRFFSRARRTTSSSAALTVPVGPAVPSAVPASRRSSSSRYSDVCLVIRKTVAHNRSRTTAYILSLVTTYTDVALSPTLHAVIDERRVLRLPYAQVLEVERLREPVEQPLAAAEDDRRDDDRQVVDELGLQRLADDVGAAHDVDVLPAGCFARSLDGLRHPGHEREAVALRLFLRPVRDDEEGQPPRVLVAPVPGGLVRPASADDGARAGDPLLEPGGVLSGRFARRLVLVRPRPAEHPVVQPLAAVAEPLRGAVVRACDVPVHGCRDACENLRHRKSPLVVVESVPLKTVRAAKTHRARGVGPPGADAGGAE